MTVGLSEEIGPVVAKSINHYFASAKGQEILQRLRELGIQPSRAAVASLGTADKRPFLGKTFVLTGTLPTLTRDAASELIREAGGTVTGSISKKADYLLAGEEAGSKLEKALSLGVKTLTEKELMDLLSFKPKLEHGGNELQKDLL